MENCQAYDHRALDQEPGHMSNRTWWQGLALVVRDCYTPNRAELEVPKDDSENFQEWVLLAASDIINNTDGVSRGKVTDFLCHSEAGYSILTNSIEECALFGTAKAEAVSKVLRDLVNPRYGKCRSYIIKQAKAKGYVAFAVKVFKDLLYIRSRTKCQKPYDCIESTIVNLLWFVSAIAANGYLARMDVTDNLKMLLTTLTDSGFASKVRQMLKVKFFHHDLFKKMFFGKSAAHYPLLKILRQLSKNAQVAQVLGKDTVMTTIRKAFSVLNNHPSGKILILVETLHQLTKERINCIRFLKAGLLVKIIRCFSNWLAWRGRGLLKLSKFVINIYNHVAKSKAGRKALVQCEALTNMRKFCEHCPSEKSFDDVIMRCAAMISLCYGKDQIPLEKMESPITFQVPEAGMAHRNESGSSSDDEDGSEDEDVTNEKSREPNEDDDDSTDDDKSISDDEEVSSELKAENEDVPRGNRQGSIGELATFSDSNKVAVDRILEYQKFYQEFHPQNLNDGDYSRRASVSKVSSPYKTEMYEENANEPLFQDMSFLPKSEHSYTWLKDRSEYHYLKSSLNLRKQYAHLANAVNHVAPCVKLAYPDLVSGYSCKPSECLQPTTDRSVLRSKLLEYISRTANTVGYKPKVIYNLDELISSNEACSSSKKRLINTDECDISKFDRKCGLKFESRFESGNLRKVTQIGELEYDLIITSDINSKRHNQWFYFQISNTNDDTYTFNFINCTKENSLFNYGMQPVVFSVTEAVKGKPGWIRSGTNICYYKNGYKCVSKKSNRVYHTLSFSLTFAHKGDIVYVAYHYPYTYTRLLVELEAMLKTVREEKDTDVLVRCDNLCYSLNKNQVPVVTITAKSEDCTSIRSRKIIFLTSRVHPGESNASWMMKGLLEYLVLGKANPDLLKKYVFKIVPMLNVEGVINGWCGLTSEDLNRCWKYPSETLHPAIFHAKMLIEYCYKVLKNPPLVYCDMHGHSRRKNLFFYGCSFQKSWSEEDRLKTEDLLPLKALPESMERVSPAFCLSFCNFDVKKSRETTARVTVWRDFDIVRSYTLECSYCGCDRSTYKGTAYGTSQLLEIGKNLCEALSDLQ